MLKKTILVVDDDPSILEIVSLMLKAEKYKVITAGSGKECLDIVKTVKPDYILLDIMMPLMDGWEVLRKIKSKKDLKDIPVAMLTAKTLTRDTLMSEDIGRVVDYISKPFTKRDLLETLNQTLRD
jgi:two-component system response regulator VicR